MKKFFGVIGNPPYQEMDGGHSASAIPIYNKFVEEAQKVGKCVTMVTPSRWFSGGRGLDEFRQNMLESHKLKAIIDYPKLYEPFPKVKIRGGVSYFVWDNEYDGMCSVQTVEGGIPIGEPVKRWLDDYDVLVRRNEAIPILNKVIAHSESTLDGRISSSKPFGLRSYYHGAEDPSGIQDPIKLYESQRVGWVPRSEITENISWIDNWKVLLTAVQGTSAAVETRFLSEPIIAAPASACTETYLVAGLFNSEQEARYYSSYLKTRFVRFLISLRKATQHAPRSVYSFVPDLNYDHTWTDPELYARYGITSDEISFIESTVAEMR